MSTVFRKRGFDAHKKEDDRRKKEKEDRSGKLWRFFLKDDDEDDVPIRFLTEEPILFYEHTIQLPGGKWGNETCVGDGCEICEGGSKPTYKGAWLVVDGREFEIDEKKDGKPTGKKKIIKDQIRLYVRGSTDIAKLDRLSRKFGLTSRPWFATKTGKDTSTSYELDRGEEDELSVKQITNLLAIAPEKYRNHYNGDEEELYQIVEANIFDDVELGESATEDEDSEPTKKSSGSKISKKSREIEEDDEDDDDDIDSGVKKIKTKSKVKKKSGTATAKKKKIFKR